MSHALLYVLRVGAGGHHHDALLPESIIARQVVMAFVVTEPCLGCKNTVCITVCPVDCFHEDKRSLWIDPDTCIDCGACAPECPVDAIFPDRSVPSKWRHYIVLNAEKVANLPVITEQREPLS